MAKKALFDHDYELIKAHIYDPENSELSNEQREMFERIKIAAKLVARAPDKRRNAYLELVSIFPNLSNTQAQNDINMAIKLYNVLHKFEYDFWQVWLIDDIAKNIRELRILQKEDPKYSVALAKEHDNLRKALGEKPEQPVDPHRHEKKDVYFAIQINNNTIKIDAERLQKLQPGSFRDLIDALTKDISITDAEEIMNS